MRTVQLLVRRPRPAAMSLPTTGTAVIKARPASTLPIPANAESIVIEEEENDGGDDNDNDEGDVDAGADDLALSTTTAQILRKFRIPKGTALTARLNEQSCFLAADDNDDAAECGNEDAAEEEDMTQFQGNGEGDGDGSGATPTPPPSAATPNSIDELVEEVIETDENSSSLQEQYQNNNNGCIVVAPQQQQQTTTATASALLVASNQQVHQQQQQQQHHHQHQQIQLQTVQPNGTVTCINLPPNTILLSSPDGSILATTAPHPHKAGHQQIIAIQDWNGAGEVLNLAANSAAAAAAAGAQQAQSATATAPSTQTTTMLLTADGTAIPILQHAATSSGHATTQAQATAANEALKAQVLA